MSLKWKVTQNGVSIKIECHSKWNVTQNEMSLKTECHSKLIVNQNAMSFKGECQANKNIEYIIILNVTQRNVI